MLNFVWNWERTQVTLVKYRPMLMGQKLWKCQASLSGINDPRESSHVKNANEYNARHFLPFKGTVHFEFISQGETFTQAYYVEISMRLRGALHRKRPELWPNNWILHYNNAPAYKVLSVRQFLAQKSITKMEYRPCSRDLSPNDLWLFPKIKSALKGRRFQHTENI
jgi:hypothetical protein